MIFQIIPLLILLFVAPAALLALLWKKREPTRFEWLIKTLYSGAFLLYAFVVGRWDWLSVYLRWVWMVLFLAAAIVSFRAVRKAPFFAAGRARQNWKRAAGNIFTLAVFVAFFGFSVRGYFFNAAPIQLAFPLKDGRYYVGQGGNSTLINYHNSHPVQKYALDIVALNPVGTRAAGFYPQGLEKYVIFDAPVFSPCDGLVVESVDGLPDQLPPQSDPEHPAGNHLIIACDGADVLLAHLRSGSVLIAQGAQVKAGDSIGRIGNSGNTSEPHLHIHAVRAGTGGAIGGEGIPMLYNGRFLVRNSVIDGE